jgi:hypothetical protein
MKKIILLIAALVMSMSVNATLITVELNDNDFNVGDLLTAQLVISDIELDNIGFQKLLASFDISTLFDDSLLSFSSVSFGNKLDVDPFIISDQFSDNSQTGIVKVVEISYAFFDDLFAAQDGLSRFVLARINFNVLASGTGAIELSAIDLGDDLAGAFTNVSAQGASFQVANSTNVPEPATIVLVLFGLAFLVRKNNA